jgi:UDP-N-acetyl-D-mannosaminuronic acid dehydrogenase
MSSIAIIGGLGHVGLPLGLFLCERGHGVDVLDPNEKAHAAVLRGEMPFIEDGAEALVKKHWGLRIRKGSAQSLHCADIVIVCIGTPLDEHGNPRLEPVLRLAKEELSELRADQLLILRSTVFPGTTQRVAETIRHPVAFCPERISQGHAIRELAVLPQIISGTTEETARLAEHFFQELQLRTVLVGTLEAELAKLFANSWRYGTIALGNEFMRIATDLGADYAQVYRALTENYERAKVPAPGLCAGPCLSKDNSQLIASAPHGFPLGLAVREVNERLSDWWLRRLNIRPGMVVCLAGMSFKPGNDDTRDSLSFRVRKLLEFRGATVVCSDPYVPGMLPLDEARRGAELTIIATEHPEYRDVRGPDVVRLWEAA